MKIIKQVIVKQVLTEKRKQTLLEEIFSQKKQIEKEIKQLEFQLHKKVKNNKSSYDQQAALKKSYSKEIRQRQEKVQLLEFKINQMGQLPLGIEIKDQTVDTICEIQVGDQWDEMMDDTEIIIKDGIIEEIRKGRSEK